MRFIYNEKRKKPDILVFNTETQKYNAALRPYPNFGVASIILPTGTISWKNRSVNKINYKVKARYLELKSEYEKMIQEFEYNKFIYTSKFTFESVVGQAYHLYKRKNIDSFLSIRSPDQCVFNFLGSFYLNVNQTWGKTEN